MPGQRPDIEAIFHAARQKPPAERPAYLDGACGDDAELRQRVEQFLGAQDDIGSFLEAPAVQRPVEAPLRQAPTDNTEIESAADAADSASLDFLSPSQKPESLGRLAHYEILEVIGKGGMGIVLRAFDEKLHRVVAIKVMAAELAATSPPRKRFLREARSAAQVRHEHVVDIHAVEDQPIPYLVMEYVCGETLQQKLDRVGPLETQEVLRLGQQMARGLAAAHERGLIHRDIKPSNILLEKGVEERVKITDFGLARAVADASLTQSGVIAGTPMYMAPEQTVGDSIDHRADLFSLGSVLYTMASGRPPFRATTSMATLKRVAEDNPRPIREIIPEVPEWLCDIIAQLHAKKPEERFQSAAAVAELLGQHRSHLENPVLVPLPAPVAPRKEAAAAAAPAPPASPPSPPGEKGGRHYWPIAAAILLVLLGGLSVTEATGVTNLRGTVIRIFTPDGTLAVETDDPGVKVTIEGDGDLVIRGAGAQEVRLRPGSYRVQASRDGKPVKLDRDLVTISRGDRQVVRVRLESAPVDGAKPIDWPVGEVRQHQWPGRKAAYAVFSPDGRYYAATGVAAEEPIVLGTLRVWELASGKLVMEVKGILWAAFTPDSKQLLAPGPDKRIHLWELATNKEVAQFGDNLEWSPPSSLSANGQKLLVAQINGIVSLYDIPGKKEIARLENESKLCAPCFCPDGKHAITSDQEGTIRLWNLEKRQVVRQWQTSDGVVQDWVWHRPLAFLPDGRRFITIGTDTVHFWDMESEKETGSLRLAGKVFAAALSADGSRLLYTLDADTTVRLVELPGGKELATFAAFDARENRPHGRMAFSLDGRFAVAACWSGLIYVWRLPDPPEPPKK
jgi:WD40 repeat protein